MTTVLKRLDRRKSLALLVLTLTLLLLKLCFTRTTAPHNSCRDLHLPKLVFACLSKDYLSESFSFPEVNETEVSLSPGTALGLKQSYSFEESGQSRFRNASVDKDYYIPFRPGLSYEERQFMLALFQTFVRACAKFSVPFFLYSGTLLGAARHNDIIPWDDDIDVILNTSDKDSLRHALSSSGDQFGIFCPSNFWWKFFWLKAKTLPHKPFRWPYIDIFFFAENETHIFDESYDYKYSFAFLKNDVFPLSFHLFAGAMLPVPCNIHAVVEHNYSPSLCSSPKFSHKYEVTLNSAHFKTIPCKHLYHLYPFVYRRVHGSLVYEEMVKDGRVVRNVISSNQCR